MANADKGLTFDAGAKTLECYLNEWLAAVEGTVRHSTFVRYRGLVENHISGTQQNAEPRSQGIQLLLKTGEPRLAAALFSPTEELGLLVVLLSLVYHAEEPGGLGVLYHHHVAVGVVGLYGHA